jgi:chorismate mutase
MTAEWNTDPVVVELREQISRADRQILETLNRRIELVSRLSDYKTGHGYPFVDRAREDALLSELARVNPGPLSGEGLREFFTSMLDLVKREVGRDPALSSRKLP